MWYVTELSYCYAGPWATILSWSGCKGLNDIGDAELCKRAKHSSLGQTMQCCGHKLEAQIRFDGKLLISPKISPEMISEGAIFPGQVGEYVVILLQTPLPPHQLHFLLWPCYHSVFWASRFPMHDSSTRIIIPKRWSLYMHCT